MRRDFMDEQQQVPSVPPPTSTATNESTADPGRTLAIVGFIFAFLFALLGLILSIVARNKSQKAGFKNTLANIGIVVSVINMILGLVINYTGVLTT
jgi:hypothetical protein